MFFNYVDILYFDLKDIAGFQSKYRANESGVTVQLFMNCQYEIMLRVRDFWSTGMACSVM